MSTLDGIIICTKVDKNRISLGLQFVQVLLNSEEHVLSLVQDHSSLQDQPEDVLHERRLAVINPHQRSGYSDSPFARKDTFLHGRMYRWVGGVAACGYTYKIIKRNPQTSKGDLQLSKPGKKDNKLHNSANTDPKNIGGHCN